MQYCLCLSMVSMGKYIFRQKNICIATIAVLLIIGGIKYLMMQELKSTLTQDYESMQTTFLSLGFRFINDSSGSIQFDAWKSVSFEMQTLVINLILLYYYHD